MVFLAAAAAIYALGTQGPDGDGSMLLLNRQVALATPKANSSVLSPEILGWSGWGMLNGVAPAPFLSNDGLETLLPKLKAVKLDPNAATWHVKVILVRAMDVIDRAPSGVLTERHSSLEASTVNSILQSLVLSARLLEQRANGTLKVQYDIEEDQMPWEITQPDGEGLDSKVLIDYVTPRINGGRFDADDKIFRGPYQQCMVINPLLTGKITGPFAAMNTFCLAYSTAAGEWPLGSMVEALSLANLAAVGKLSSDRGYPLVSGSEAGQGYGGSFAISRLEQAADLLSPEPVSTDGYLTHVQSPGLGTTNVIFGKAGGRAPVSANAQVTLVKDLDKGTVLSVRLAGIARSGGMALPVAALGTLVGAPAHILTFSYKAASADSLGIGVISNPGSENSPFKDGVSLGPRPDPGMVAAIPADGAWHRVAIDLTKLPGASGGSGLYVGALPGQARYPLKTIAAPAGAFTDFQVVSTMPTDAVEITTQTVSPLVARLQAVRAAANAAMTPDGETVMTQALSDPIDEVRLNALDMLGTVKAPGLEAKIAENVGNVNPRISELAIAALANLGTDSAWATIKVAVRIGPGELTKAAAAKALSSKHDPQLAGPLSALLALHNWRCRVAGAEAVAANGGPNEPILLGAFLQDTDPSVRYAVAQLTDPASQVGLQRLLFSSVNDSSDAVRSVACIKLLESKFPDLRKEGYRGALDDSWWVRTQVLGWIQKNPGADDRATIRQAVVSPDYRVRAAALSCFATSPGTVSFDEISNTLKDPIPAVQRALIQVVQAKGLKLPPDALAGLKASIDPNVATLAASLGV